MQLNNTVYFTVAEAAPQLRRSQDWLWAMCRNRKVPHHRRGRQYLFTIQDIRAIDAMYAPVPVEVEA